MNADGILIHGPLPESCDLILYSFMATPGRCLRMIYSPQLQATHCYEPPAWKGIWKDRKGKSRYAEACTSHAPKLLKPLA